VDVTGAEDLSTDKVDVAADDKVDNEVISVLVVISKM
jgi:hypothetical protein